MKYKVGDIVCIKSMFDIGTIIDSKGKVGNLPFKVAMNDYCCSRLTIKEVDSANEIYKMKEDPLYLYNDDMIECKVGEDTFDLIDDIKTKAEALGQKYFPDECNVWARGNTEALYVTSACVEMARWLQKRMIDNACKWWGEQTPEVHRNTIDAFREYMEKQNIQV